VLKCGGGKALTKQPVDENILKLHLPVEETNKVGESNNALVVCGAQVSHELEEKIKVPSIRNETKPERNKSGKIMPKLYNLENCIEPAKLVKIDLDLDLYQMEQV
jgi:hypothetical protein